MESTPGGIIPLNKLKIWKVFRHVGPEGKEILKTAKLAHVVDTELGFVVSKTDETYFFLIDKKGECKTMKIPNLCGVRVREFVVAPLQSQSFAVTEDGLLYSWIKVPCWVYNCEQQEDEIMGCLAPRLEQLSLAGKKVQQVVLGRASRVMALTMDGHVFHWVRDMYPVLIHKKNFDYQEVISLACTDDMYVALTSNGELFQHSSACPVSKWRPGRDLEPQKVILDSARVKKIVAISHIIFALTVEGTLYSGRVSQERKPVWGVVMKNLKFHDVAANAGSDDVVLAELKKNKVCLALSYRGGIFDPQVLSISSNVTLLDELFAEISSSTWRTIWADGEVEGGLMKPGKMGDDIGNLWGNKENVDVTFSVEGKTISAHKLILTSRSEYFAKMFSNEWKEAKSGSCIEIKDTKFEIFEALLFYIYQDKVKFAGDAYENIFGLMMLADAHCAVKIRRECEQILMRNINPENAVFLVRNAASANASNLESNVIRFILDNRLLNVGSSPQELIDLLGMDAFQKISVAGLRRL